MKVSAIQSKKISEKIHILHEQNIFGKKSNTWKVPRDFGKEINIIIICIGKALEISSKMHNAKSERPHIATC